MLTVATDQPAYPPWFENNNLSNGQGYESAVAYAVAAQLGFSKSQVKWAYEPFNDSYAPGPKKFDFDINGISVTPQRAQAVTFSISYYADQQALVALKGTPIVTKHTPADLKGYVYGDQVGTTSLAFINSAIQPTATPKVYETLNDVKQALQTHQIAALVTDTPTAQYISPPEIPNSLMVAQFPSSGEHYGLLFRKGNPLVRQSSGPVLFPLRVISTIYVDVFRGVPLVLVVFALRFGVPALSLQFLSTQSAAVYGVAALGLSHWTSLRHVILPQAVRTIIPPLLNDFISPQKDTALVGVLGAIEANKAAEIYSDTVFNYSSYTVAAILFLILTIPLARYTDHLIAKDRERRLAGGVR